jgi:hypothetical protein
MLIVVAHWLLQDVLERWGQKNLALVLCFLSVFTGEILSFDSNSVNTW